MPIRRAYRTRTRLSLGLIVCLGMAAVAAEPQAGTTAGTVEGAVTDPTGAAVPGAKVQMRNLVTHYDQAVTTDLNGAFRLLNVPPNPYHLNVTAPGFQPAQRDVTVRTAVPITVNVQLALETAKTELTVHSEAADILESTPTEHTDVDRDLIGKLPVSPSGTGISDVITLATPGVVADSNGMFHPLGEHSDTTLSLDNQPISDQQSKTFSNQLALNTIQSMEVIAGVPPPEYGDKAGLVINAMTRSGMGLKQPTGSFSAQYGSFGTWGENFAFGAGGKKWGNFLALNSAGSGRFLDTPEFLPLHAHGNAETGFDRLDLQPAPADTVHLNVSVSRSWLQVPNTYDQHAAGQDQRQWLRSFNISPGWSHLFGASTLLSVTPWVRQDLVKYYPSRDPFSDLPATFTQQRRLTNFGTRAAVSYVHGIHNAKAGVQVMHYLLSEDFHFGLTDPEFNPPCLTPAGEPAGQRQPCAAGLLPNPDFQGGLLPYDLTRGGAPFRFRGHADIKQEAVYLQDTLTMGGATLMLGVRGDNYNGLTHSHGVQPRAGISYLFKPSKTVFRFSYGRLFETPYNENLVLSSATGAGGLATNVFGAFGARAIQPGKRHQFNTGLEQALGRWMIVNANYFWKFTDNAFDFDTLFNTPLAFPTEWRKSKADGLAARFTVLNVRGLHAYTDIGHTRARFFGPEVGGLLFNSPLSAGAFRVDHDQAFEQTTHLQYEFPKNGPWIAFTWRYDSGMAAGAVPDFETALSFSGDQQAAMGLFCGSTLAAVDRPIRSCDSPRFGANRIRIPAAGTFDEDRNPARMAPRHLFDLGLGIDNLLRTDRPRLALRVTVLNLSNTVALYNFLSTFSGTHFVTPRSYQAEITIAF